MNLKIRITKYALAAFIGAFLVAFLFTSLTYAKESSDSASAKKFGITFPIVELGNCENVNSCKAFCADETNREACVNFAKKKGFYKKSALETKKTALIAFAKKELGCDSEEACKAACSKKENHDKCKAMAQRFNLDDGAKKHGGEILKKAQEILGCQSEDECKGICQKPENIDKCSSFAKSVGLDAGIRRVGPGGCNSEDSCKAFCADTNNFEQCSKFAKKGRFRGPGGCASKGACEEFCRENPDTCQKFKDKFEKKVEKREDFKNSSESSRMKEEFKKRGAPTLMQKPPEQGFDRSPSEFNPTGSTEETPPPPASSPNVTALPLPKLEPERSVQGVSTHKNFFQNLLDFIFQR